LVNFSEAAACQAEKVVSDPMVPEARPSDKYACLLKNLESLIVDSIPIKKHPTVFEKMSANIGPESVVVEDTIAFHPSSNPTRIIIPK